MSFLDISLAYGDTFYFMVGALVLFVALFIMYLSKLDRRDKRYQAGVFSMRHIQPYNAAREGLSRAAETGRAVHTSPGTGSIASGGAATASTLAGLTLVETMARVSAITGAPAQATTNDAVAFALTENALRSGYGRAGWTMDRESGGARFLTHSDPLAYVAGASDVVDRQNVSHAVMAGQFGPEVLFLMEAQRRAGAQQITGSSEPQGAALMFVAGDQTLIGEEIFASGAYLERRPTHIASLMAQDGLRWAVILVIVAGFVAANVFGKFPLDFFTMYP
jgi:hypothetical protein